MANIFDYLKWRGDLSLEQSEFNEIDNIILAELAYIPFEEIMEEDEIVLVKELGERFTSKTINKSKIIIKEDINFFPFMAKTKRFGEMKVCKYVNKISSEEEKQFSAVTIIMTDGTIYVSYRGTDYTIVGWKEDFNMSFKSHVPAQIDSVKYLQTIADSLEGNIRVGGHSKGGNLAVYASMFASLEVKNRIINIYNNDGPGFNDDVTNTKNYREIIEKIHTYIPQDSFFGRLFNHEEKYFVIESSQKGLMQHDLYSWKVLGNQLVHLKEVTNGSELIDKTIKDWFKQTTPEQREQVVDIVFNVINTTKAKNFLEIRNNWLTHAKTILTTYRNIAPESKRIIIKTLSALLKIGTDNFWEAKPKKYKAKKSKKGDSEK